MTQLKEYPWEGKFQTIEEIKMYFKGDRIQCLLCGKWFKHLGIHVTRTHKMTVDNYQILYGLPYDRGLTCDDFHKNHSVIAKRLIREGVNALSKKEVQALGREIARQHPPYKDKPIQPFNKLRMKKAHKRHPWYGKGKYTTEEVLSAPKRAKEAGISLRELFKHPSEPSEGTYYNYLRKYKKDI